MADAAGGALDMQEGDPLELRIFVDGSAVEVFTGTGQVLSTRCAQHSLNSTPL